MRPYLSHAKMAFAQSFDSGLLYTMGGYVLRFLRLIMLMTLWRGILAAEGSIDAASVLAYTFWASVLGEQLNVFSSLSEDFWDGSAAMRYLRPLPVLGQAAAETMGRWVPGLIIYSLPMLLLAAPLGMPIGPSDALHGLCALPSLLLTLSLGFAVDYLFAAMAVRLHNSSYQAKLIRHAFTLVCTGALIPFSLMPWGIGELLALSPFGSLAGAPLSIYTGMANIPTVLIAQCVWNAVLWPLALLCYHKSEEKMVMHGG